ncbi:MAG: response regulator [Candidatus Omnitrophota bacterium]
MRISEKDTSGIEVLEDIRKTEDIVSTPVIILTGKDDDMTRLKTMRLKNAAYIVKPFNVEELDNIIESVLSNNG